ncbi:uncharacterized protein LOC123273776 [Cotesia glomerata]|uniref:uncharacterized protein LOC123273776 n=1 Tax=Cotesia glomerata TaxID=32391 RepID=UPI001D025984|nr:uncharacterized protein LOC123273776 [Cotesia glomerata]
MGRRKIERTPAEEEDIKRLRNDKRKTSRYNKRNMQEKKLHCHNGVSNMNTLNSQNIDDIVQNVATSENTCSPLNSTAYDIINNIQNVPSTSKNTSTSRIAEFESENSGCMHSSDLSSILPVRLETSCTRNDSLLSSYSDHNYCYPSILNCITSNVPSQQNDTSSFTYSQSQHQLTDHDYSRPLVLDSTISHNHLEHHSIINNTFSSSAASVNENSNHNEPSDQINVNNVANIDTSSEHYIGNMIVKCRHCTAKHFTAEKVANKYDSFNDCCRHGEVNLGLQQDPPELLKTLFSGTHVKSKNFFDCIRNYNNSFSFASFNANLTNLSSQRRGPYCFKIQGKIYYQVNTSLYPSPNESPSYGQLFIVDTNEAAECRSARNINCEVDLLKAIDNTLRHHNVFARSYEMMKDVLKDNSTIDSDGNAIEPELNLIFTLKPGMDARRYNFQRINEVAAVFSTTADGEIPESYVTVQNKTTKSFQFLSTMDPNTEPWIYPLFYLYGNQGWHKSIPYQYLSNTKPIEQ